MASKLSKKVDRLLAQQAALAEFGRYAFRSDDLHDLLTEAARVSAACLNVPYCKICRYRSDEGDLLVEAGVGWKSGVIGHACQQADESSPAGRAFVTGQPVIARDRRVPQDFVLPPLYAQHGIVSTVNVVIQGG